MITEQEFYETEGWYDNDLHLAAELGKTLLERNKDLESQLRQCQQNQYEQAKEIDLLTKQLEALRNVNESRMRIYEDVDKNLLDLEKTNQKLVLEAKVDKGKIKSLQSQILILDTKAEELQTRNEELVADARKRKSRIRETKRTKSVPSLSDTDEPYGFGGADEFGGFKRSNEESRYGFRNAEEKQIKDLKDTLKNVRKQLKEEQHGRNDLENEISCLVTDNQELENKVQELEQEHRRVRTLEKDLQSLELNSGSVCKLCGDNVKKSKSPQRNSDDIAIEHDDLQELPRGQLVRLKNGGSAYGSRESLHTLGLDIEDDALALEISSITYDEIEYDREETPEFGERSILGEMEDQYRNLVKKYEALVDKKAKRRSVIETGTCTQDNLTTTPTGPAPTCISRPTELLGVEGDFSAQGGGDGPPSRPRSMCLDLTSPIEGHFENGPPEYKKLFKEIFETLRRSVVIDDGTEVTASAEKKVDGK